LEELWNELSKKHRFALFCAYPLAGFNEEAQGQSFNEICNCHSRVIPSESYSALANPDERLRAISNLQQKAQSLRAEIKRRKEVEKALSVRDRELTDTLRHVVDPHGQPVNQTDVAPGNSTLVTQPSAAVEEQYPRIPRTDGQTTLSKQRILVVDDNKDSADTLSILLRLKGHEIYTARDGLEAIDAVTAFRPTVILMDVAMPKLNGYDATQRIRNIPGGSDIFIVALTGWGQPEDVEPRTFVLIGSRRINGDSPAVAASASTITVC
jgi:CheY-like chemotaxis protein